MKVDSVFQPGLPVLFSEGDFIMTTNATNTGGHGPRPWGTLILFVLFLVLLAVVLMGMGWCIGGVCEVGTNMLLP